MISKNLENISTNSWKKVNFEKEEKEVEEEEEEEDEEKGKSKIKQNQKKFGKHQI